jgi:mono/diheme cytochrome c family protein
MRAFIAASLSILSLQCTAAERMGCGEAEYLNSCAACHGLEGRGNGPLAALLTKRPADLTRLSEKNGGTFPYDRVVQVIDGRDVLPLHGSREMPVWGRQFLEEDTKTYGSEGGEIVTAERIRGLADYLKTLQH